MSLAVCKTLKGHSGLSANGRRLIDPTGTARQLMAWMAPSLGIECHNGGRRRSPVTGAIHGQYYSNRSRSAKNVFQVHAVDEAGSVVMRKQLRRGQVLAFFAGIPSCLVGLEACATAHIGRAS
jgi:hypothetical protein